MLQRIREFLAIFLVALLPFHALLVTFLTKIFIGPELQPFRLFALWKEFVLLLLLCLALYEILYTCVIHSDQRRRILSVDAFDIGLIVALAYVFFFFRSSVLTPQFLLGFKYDFFPLVTFFFLRRVRWSSTFIDRLCAILVMIAVGMSVYGLLTLVLPMAFFVWLGYSDLHSLYLADAPLAAFQQIGGTMIRRVQSTMSGPNQFGLWLLLPLGYCLSQLQKNYRHILLVQVCILLLGIFLSYSRAAWLGSFFMIVCSFCMTRAFSIKKFFYSSTIFLVFCIIFFSLFSNIFLRSQSSRDHFRLPLRAVQTMFTHPLGRGLGSAGPASNAVSDTCVFLSSGSDTTWAKNRDTMCIFVDDVQVQPSNRICQCPFLTENWYLQWGVEMGFFGLFISVFLLLFTLVIVYREHLGAFLAFAGLSIAGIFLHSFEDTAIAYSLWILLAVHVSSLKFRKT